MRKILTAAVAALTLGGAVAATAPAEARPYGHRYHHRHNDNDNDAGVAIAAGVVGLALGAALASDSRRGGYYSYDRGYYGGGYYSRPYRGGYYGRPYYGGYYSRPYYRDRHSYYGRPYGYYNRGYRTCTSKRWVYDPYLGREVRVRSRYAC